MRKKLYLCLIILFSLILIICTKVNAYSNMPGDVNLDGKVDKKDSYFLSRYLRGRETIEENKKDQALKNADVYKDGIINSADVEIIVKYNHHEEDIKNNIVNNFDKLPYSPNIGDANLDGMVDELDIKLIYKYIEYEGYYHGCMILNDAQKGNTDVYKDGKINWKDAYFIMEIESGELTDVPVVPLSGDVNLDGKINDEDINEIIRNQNLFDENLVKFCNADVYEDGIIDEADADILRMYYLQKIESLPYTPLKGDVNFDGIIDKADLNVLKDCINNSESLNNAIFLNGNVYDNPYSSKKEITNEDWIILNRYLRKTVKEIPYNPVKGDINLDGVFDKKDINLLNNYLRYNNVNLNEIQKCDANLYYDWTDEIVLDEKDLKIMKGYFEGEYKEIELPWNYYWDYSPIYND